MFFLTINGLQSGKVSTEESRVHFELTWLQDLDYDSLVGLRVDTLVDFRVLASSDLLNDFVVVLRPNGIDYVSKG